MGGFLDWFFAFLTTMIGGVFKIISGIFGGIFQIFNVGDYLAQFNDYKAGFGVLDWILSIVAFLLVMAIWGIVIFMLVLLIRKYVRFRRSAVGSEELLEEVAKLHRDVLRLTKEKERILALKIGETAVSVDELNAIFSEEDEETATSGTETTEDTEAVIGELVPRFTRLDAVDKKYQYYVPPVYREGFTLEDLCRDFRNFACSRMGLYYEEKVVRTLFAGLASTKLILLQGISGTGKTSLPYAMGKFFENDATIVSVQPSWRDRTELFGYYNEFSRRFNETEVLRTIYEAAWNDDVNVIILDEMNIARVEYYFAEMLSIMEMPDPNEWRIEIVPSSWENDPVKLTDGKLRIPQNIWYIGTANNDDSTFSVSDKVYDRALTINIDNKGIPFEAPDTPPSRISFSSVEALYRQAVLDHPLEERYLTMIEDLDSYVIKKFRVAFGNRIMKQMKVFVPAYVACGGTVVEAIDHILATKVFRKFESLNLALIRDELKGLINYLDTLFGKGTMVSCIEFLDRLQRTY
ncbi:MAG: hypothetical protein IKC73_07170 [Clostridia bacterium]|nr:hypothetical protein [Clostridia bacterium]